MKLKDAIGWAGTALTLTGVSMQAASPALIPWSYAVFLVSASVWFSNARIERNRPHMTVQTVLLALNAIAAWRYLIPEVFP